MNTTQIVITIFRNRFPMDGFNLPLHQERNAFFVFVQINFHKDNLFFMKIEIIKLGVVTVGLVFLPKFYYFILFSPMTQLFVLFFDVTIIS